MPDFDIHVYYHCNSAEHFSTEIHGSKTYTVTYGPSRGMYEYDYSCTCDSFKFGKGKPCKHIKQVKASGKHCAWMQFTEGGKPVDKDGMKFCPKCGSEVSVARYAV